MLVYWRLTEETIKPDPFPDPALMQITHVPLLQNHIRSTEKEYRLFFHPIVEKKIASIQGKSGDNFLYYWKVRSGILYS